MKNSIKNINQRQQQILDILKEHKKMATDDLANLLHVSISTIRRDLNILEEKNDIIRTHGYCSYNYKNQEDFDETGPVRIKKAIALEAAKFIKDFDTLFINTSSTALMALQYNQAKNLTIVTNNLKIVYLPHDSNSSYILTGGEMRVPKEALVGDIAIHTISSMNADSCIIGCSGIDLQNGVTTKILNEARINELMINKTIRNKILVADHRKIGTTSKFKIADISVFDYLITDQYSSDEVLREIAKMGVKVIKVQI